jgi:hypothetical protein
MSHYEEIVAEYLCFGRTRFVSPGFSLDLGGVGPHGKGRNWWIDVLAVDFKEQTIYLCEATFARHPTYMFARLRAWTAVWPEICENLFRVTHAPHSWTVKPWIFTPNDLKSRIELGIAAIRDCPFDYKWTAFEDIVPWKRQQYSAIAAAAKRVPEAGHRAGNAESPRAEAEQSRPSSTF